MGKFSMLIPTESSNSTSIIKFASDLVKSISTLLGKISPKMVFDSVEMTVTVTVALEVLSP